MVEFALEFLVCDLENPNISHLVIFLFAIVTVFRKTFQVCNKAVDCFAWFGLLTSSFCLARGTFFLTLKGFSRHVIASSNSLASSFTSSGYVLQTLHTPRPARGKSKAHFCSLSSALKGPPVA